MAELYFTGDGKYKKKNSLLVHTYFEVHLICIFYDLIFSCVHSIIKEHGRTCNK